MGRVLRFDLERIRVRSGYGTRSTVFRDVHPRTKSPKIQDIRTPPVHCRSPKATQVGVNKQGFITSPPAVWMGVGERFLRYILDPLVVLHSSRRRSGASAQVEVVAAVPYDSRPTLADRAPSSLPP